jgi:hypothetical protein
MFSFWPGYYGIVRHGRWSFLVIALIFALFLDTFLVVNFYWTALITLGQRNILLGLFLAVWVGLFVAAMITFRSIETASKQDEEDLVFREAVFLYLRGDWLGTESLLLPQLKKNPRDIEMLLLLATLYRRTERYPEASAVLDKLGLLENTYCWFLEIETERRFIAEAVNEPEAVKGQTETGVNQ